MLAVHTRGHHVKPTLWFFGTHLLVCIMRESHVTAGHQLQHGLTWLSDQPRLQEHAQGPQ